VRRLRQETVASITYRRRCFQPKAGQKSAVTDFHHPAVFPLEFSVLPQKTSAYLRTDSSSGANTRNMRDFYNLLNINDLCSKSISLQCNMHHFGLRNGLFRRLKSTISHPEMGNIRTQNVSFRTMIWGISKGDTARNRSHNAVFNIPLHLFRENILSKFNQENQ